MTFAVEWLLAYVLIVSMFLGLRMFDWLCGMFSLAFQGGLDPVVIKMNEPRQFRQIAVRGGTVALILIAFAAVNWSNQAWQIGGLSTLGLLLTWRWLYFVENRAFARGALAMAVILPFIVTASAVAI